MNPQDLPLSASSWFPGNNVGLIALDNHIFTGVNNWSPNEDVTG